MKLLQASGIALSLAVICLLAPTASADDWNRKTVITFNEPVEVPGVGQHNLPAGTYVFRILDSQSDRHIVQIFNQDETQVLTTILAIPNYRLKTTDKTVITFRERPSGQPEALRAWFYPGHEWGEEFVYEKPRAIELAKETNTPVLATRIPLAAAPVDTLRTVPVEAIAPTGEPVALEQVVEAPPAPPTTVASAEPLPKTASPLALIALLGLVTITAGSGLMAFSKRTLRIK